MLSNPRMESWASGMAGRVFLSMSRTVRSAGRQRRAGQELRQRGPRVADPTGHADDAVQDGGNGTDPFGAHAG